ncbi:MAG: potassium transporter TrkG [Gammaproteobacteria bacterium]
MPSGTVLRYSTGGFSTHDDSLGFFNSPLIEAIAIVLMLAGAMNFSVHFLSWRQRSLKVYWRKLVCGRFY